MVGDIKQSIYRFRLADPDIFNAKYSLFTPVSEMAGEDAGIVVDMNRNYRSKAPIRRFINRTFSGLMEGYDDRAALHGPEGEEEPPVGSTGLGADPAGGAGSTACAGLGDEPLIALLDTGELRNGELYLNEYDDETRSEILDMKHDELEALFVASLIRSELGKIFKPGNENAERPLRQGDIAILARSNTPAGIFRKALGDLGLRCIVNENDGYFDTIEIEVFMALLSVLDNRQQDVPLLTVLHSEMFGFDAEDLARIRAENPAGSFFKAFAAYCAGGRIEDLRERCAEALALIDDWRRLARVMPLPDIIWKIMLDSGYYLFMGALPDGKRRQANMRMLCDKAEAYASEGESSLYGFIKYIETIRDREVKMPEAKLTGDREDAVRIMTMHKSKGLEFPMVIVTGLSRKLTYETSGKISFHKDLGLGLRYYREYGREFGTVYRPTALQKLIVGRVRDEEYAEQVRVLYVAMTRARDKLILTGTLDDPEKFAERARTDLRTRSSYLNMISPHCNYRIFGLGGSLEAASGVTAAPQEAGAAVSAGTEAFSPVTAEEKRALLEQLGYAYPYEDARSIRSKYSVTEINKMLGPDHEQAYPGEGRGAELAIPSFAVGERRLTAAERGTIYHALMEEIDFADVPTDSKDAAEARVREMIETFRSEGMFSEEEIEAVDISNIASFFMTDLGKRTVAAARAGRLSEERAFTMKLVTKGEPVLVQGIIDCFFTEGEGADERTVLLDYKSNYYDLRKPEEEELRLRNTYSGQIALYRRALEMAGLPPVKEAYLYLLAVKRLIDMSDTEWGDAGIGE
ncbi:MAG: PD-(D/E)XK nuclease family protein [Firmicutes bacterium]|nr:PD-(D/E)XK nuclease family protein [Bacillota bacterium]